MAMEAICVLITIKLLPAIQTPPALVRFNDKARTAVWAGFFHIVQIRF